MAPWEVLASLLLLAPVAIAVVSPGEDEISTSGTVHHVHIDGFAMDPDPLVIETGDTVEWHNHDGVPHTATEGSPGGGSAAWSTGSLSSGETAQITFDSPADDTYYCEVHPGSMTGFELVVEETVDGPAPDLVIPSLEAEETETASTVTITADVENQGTAASPATTAAFTAQGADGQEHVATEAVPALDPGESTEVEVTWDALGKVGAFEIEATVDPDETVLEARETNNDARTQVCLPDAEGLTCNVDGRDVLDPLVG